MWQSRRTRAWALVVVVLGLPLVVVAAPETFDRASAVRVLDAAKGELQKGQLVQALDTLTGLAKSLRQHAPLRVPRVVVVEKPAGGLGKFTPASNGLVAERTVQLYVEIENARGRVLVDGQSEVALEISGAFRYEGEEIGERALGVHQDVWREVPPILAVGLDFALAEKAPPGVYTLTVKVTDTVSSTTARAETRFTLR
jgi:hypothetical protein